MSCGNKNCPCSHVDCPRHGNCCQCVAHHHGQDAIPACFFSPEAEKKHDRSIEHFIADYRARKNK